MASPAMIPLPVPQTWPAIHDCPAAPDYETATDKELVAAAKMGDKTAFGRLIERHYRFCLIKAHAILRNRGDAEDEVQNACANACKHLDQFQGEGSFGGWLNRIVSNQCLMRIRERKGARMISVDEVFDSEGAFRLDVIDQRSLPEDLVGDSEVSRLLKEEIRRVPLLLREALIMRELGQLDMCAIAARLNISVPAAKSRLMRARLELKRRLVKHQGARGAGTLLHKSNRRRAAYVRAN